MDEDMPAIDVADFEIERRLDSYARARLNPDPETVARIRARVMREARLQFDARPEADHPSAAKRPLRTIIPRRVAMPLLAASVWLGLTAGSILAAQPGGPLYGPRIWIERMALPSGGSARATAEVSRLDARLAEVLRAAESGDTDSFEAALAAYGSIADEAAAGAVGDADLEDTIAAALDRHRAVLADVVVRPTETGDLTAAAAVEASLARAMVHAQAVLDRVGAVGSGSSTRAPASNGGGSRSDGNANGGNAGNGGTT